MISVVTLAGYWAGSTVDYAGEAVAQYAYLMRDAANDFAGYLEEHHLSPLGIPFKIIAFVMDASGKIVKVVAGTIADGVRNLVDGSAMTIENIVNVPVSLLKLDAPAAGRSLAVAVGSGLCTTVDVLFLPIRLIIGLTGNEQPKSCLASQKEMLRDGSYWKPRPVTEQIAP